MIDGVFLFLLWFLSGFVVLLAIIVIFTEWSVKIILRSGRVIHLVNPIPWKGGVIMRSQNGDEG